MRLLSSPGSPAAGERDRAIHDPPAVRHPTAFEWRARCPGRVVGRTPACAESEGPEFPGGARCGLFHLGWAFNPSMLLAWVGRQLERALSNQRSAVGS